MPAIMLRVRAAFVQASTRESLRALATTNVRLCCHPPMHGASWAAVPRLCLSFSSHLCLGHAPCATTGPRQSDRLHPSQVCFHEVAYMLSQWSLLGGVSRACGAMGNLCTAILPCESSLMRSSGGVRSLPSVGTRRSTMTPSMRWTSFAALARRLRTIHQTQRPQPR